MELKLKCSIYIRRSCVSLNVMPGDVGEVGEEEFAKEHGKAVRPNSYVWCAQLDTKGVSRVEVD